MQNGVNDAKRRSTVHLQIGQRPSFDLLEQAWPRSCMFGMRQSPFQKGVNQWP